MTHGFCHARGEARALCKPDKHSDNQTSILTMNYNPRLLMFIPTNFPIPNRLKYDHFENALLYVNKIYTPCTYALISKVGVIGTKVIKVGMCVH